MKILNIIAQKPDSTGSGIYCSELVKCFNKMGHKQEIICGIYGNDDLTKLNNITELTVNPVIFSSNTLPINIAGMSDEMPYPSTKYKEFIDDKQKLNKWKESFYNKIIESTERFNPDLIICHHLYLLTAITRDICKKYKIYGICHNTDLRQFLQTNLCREYIKENIQKLDKIFALTKYHKELIIDIFNVDKNKINIIGTGYNSDIFYDKKIPYENKKNKIIYVGKIANKKGVLSLIKAFNKINDENLTLDLIGGAGNTFEYNEIVKEATKNNLNINFKNSMQQDKLAIEYNNHEIFVLPSFSEGLPMVPIEAMACGCKIVISDLAGVKMYYDENVKNAVIEYVMLPKLTNVDNAKFEEFELFEDRLKKAIIKVNNINQTKQVEFANISWEEIAKKIVNTFLEQ